MQAAVHTLKEHYQTLFPSLREDYFAFLRIPSVSTDPKYKQEVLRCCDWVKEHLRKSGLQVEEWKTPSYPVVFATDFSAGPSKPTLLIYAHYDVQPTDPEEEWLSPPFEPTERNGKVYARGANDNKGQLIYALHVLRLLKQMGPLPVNIKCIFEGEEENKSHGLFAVLEDKASLVKADYIVSPDFDLYAPGIPQVTVGVRGNLALEVILQGSSVDMHSGMGGAVYNPNHALVDLLARLRDRQGRVTLPGFYDDIVDLPIDQLSLEIDEEALGKDLQTTFNGGEPGYSPGERMRIRPTLELCGISGGYAGDGFKTVIPAKASAKISCRLVPNQDPDKISATLKQYFLDNAPKGMRVSFIEHGGAPAMRGSVDSPANRALAQAYSEVFNVPCRFSTSAGSIPIAALLTRVSGAPASFMGVGLASDRVHAPNECFDFERMEQGFLSFARFIQILGE